MDQPIRHRITQQEEGMALAWVVAQRGTCVRRKVGAIITDHEGHILSTGRNGTAKNKPHCIDTPCDGAKAGRGESLDKCEAIHAEANALLSLKETEHAKLMYCTTMPCTHCLKLISNSNIEEIFYAEEYPQSVKPERIFSGKLTFQPIIGLKI